MTRKLVEDRDDMFFCMDYVWCTDTERSFMEDLLLKLAHSEHYSFTEFAHTFHGR